MEPLPYLLLALLVAAVCYAHTQIVAVQVQWRQAVDRERNAYRTALLATKQVQFHVEPERVQKPAPSATLFASNPLKTQEQQFAEFQQGWTQTDFAAFEAWANHYYQGHAPDTEQVIAEYVSQYGMDVKPLDALR